ncbi:hypothetical protein A3B26_01650 [Candidatus Giovannonibacteria bacterium RIFCSPLOWO2_01_FULL_48_47]|nr:MAG: hypothetical protein A3D61_02930 [Candidatus Giovannonibacteria bacterium RIFCSPHIGHO2_02_FULL_48_15]OGF88413.1 MAG: hypothetical protein A3B26_01650 [Candidatus Giovannonibacteria bacterium RIFCSPLOWO2_01_FULL_48_47]OGF96270.1 MAG: hypothetical protein A2613_01760 [Candidatus Giovannonibacteria bacterium RIFOXYD1_FULL_48_21]HBT81820.1 hypothetical protein [Candidatus Giovannonibacteria bacterium]
MINLLPYEDKKELELEKRRRFLVVALFGASVIVFLGLILMGPIYLSLALEKRSFLRELDSASQAEPLQRLAEVEQEIGKLNSKLLLLDQGAKRGLPVSELLRRALGLAPAGIRIDSLSFSRGKIFLGGQAQKREDLQTFIQALEAASLFRKISSPVSNLLKSVDLKFSLELELAAP